MGSVFKDFKNSLKPSYNLNLKHKTLKPSMDLCKATPKLASDKKKVSVTTLCIRIWHILKTFVKSNLHKITKISKSHNWVANGYFMITRIIL